MSTTLRQPSLKCIGASRDGRTNQWRLSCACGHDFCPPTTRIGCKEEQCPKCGRILGCDYNAGMVSLRKSA